ncbi:NAD-dependent epimerase/dehydratase family protein [Humisphaera borealis]|uniref:NAD(P)H-binding protein n=1 Tax=Humisphaera borealis TaxID=2807512 RepID=A0A7M2WT05_9BACT|nr:NAD-dependent epimerase/dehydratase family protein [Humisphaera borealis]QOV87951.1 NAD(P)H-binding protein [Humisphaera borealis]
MKLLITGANGFLGKYVVAEALRRGHSVRAMVRSPKDADKNGWTGHPQIEAVQGDLRKRRELPDVIRGCDAVLHLAAAKAGDMYAQYGGTVVATENLLWAMEQANVTRIVSISSFSVYDYMAISYFSTVDEMSPVEKDAFDRDEYAHTKLVQERLVRMWCTERNWTFTILRPGVIFGRDNLWSARMGMKGGKAWIRIGAWAHLPLTYVENCAEAIVAAAEAEGAKNQILNVVDDETPTQRKYVKLLAKRQKRRPWIVPVPYSLMWAIAGGGQLFNKWFCGGGAKIPGLFVPCRLAARAKPLKYTNQGIKNTMGWKPRFNLKESLDRSLSEVDAGLAEVKSR